MLHIGEMQHGDRRIEVRVEADVVHIRQAVAQFPSPGLKLACRRTEFGSNSGMEHPHDTEQRLTDLEIKASFTEDLLDQLNGIIVRQQQQIDLLVGEIARLQQQVPEEGAGVFRSLRDELPPHY